MATNGLLLNKIGERKMYFDADKSNYIMMLKAVANGCATADDLRERGSVYITYLTDAVRNGDLIRKEGIYTCTPKALEFIKHYNRLGKRIK